MSSKRTPFMKSGLIAAACAAMLVSACSTSTGGDSGGGGGDKTITILSLYSADSGAGKWLENVASQYEKEHPGTTVKNQFDAQTSLPTDYGKAVIAGNEPELVMTNRVGDPTSWIKNKAAVPVTDYIQQWGLGSLFSKAAVSSWTFNGQVEAFPLEGYNWPMWFNMDLLTKAGITAPPTTTDDLVTDAKKLRAAGIQPWAVAGSDYTAPAVLSVIAAGVLGTDNAAKLYDSGNWGGADGQKAISELVRLRDAGVFTDNSAGLKYPDQVAAFAGGKAAMLFDGSWGFGNAAQKFPTLNVQLGGIPLPAGSPESKPLVVQGQSTGVWVSPNGQKKISQVEDLVKLMYTGQNLGSFVQNGFISPAPLSKLTLDQSKLPPLNVQSQTALPERSEFIDGGFYNNLAPTVLTAFFRAGQQAFVPGTSVATVTTSLEQAWQAK